MRISDWSSDVCSSDLLCKAQGGSEIKAAEPPGKTDQTRHDADLTMKALRHQLEHRAIADAQRQHCYDEEDRKSVVEGKSVSVRVDLGGSRSIKKKKTNTICARHHEMNKYQTYQHTSNHRID